MLPEGAKPNMVENLSTDVTNDDQKMEPMMRPALVMKFLMVIWLFGVATLSQMISCGLGAWLISISSCDSSICWATLSVTLLLKVTKAIVVDDHDDDDDDDDDGDDDDDDDDDGNDGDSSYSNDDDDDDTCRREFIISA